MAAWQHLIAWLAGRWNRPRYERELDDELRAHLELETDELIDGGLPPADARAQVHRQFGRRVWVVKEEARDAWGWGAWDRLAQDVRAAQRLLRRNPAFTLVAVASLALGIGANAAIFSLVDLVSLRTLPIPEPNRLVRIVHSGTRGASATSNAALFRALQEQNTADGDRAVFSGLFQIGGFDGEPFKVRHGGRVDIVEGQSVRGDYHGALGVEAAIGRTLAPADSAGPNPVVVLSDGYWRRQFGANPDALGQTLVIDNQPHTIIGVTPPSFFGLQIGRQRDLTIPRAMPAEDDRQDWVTRTILGRLAPGVTAEQASVRVDAVFQTFMQTSSLPADMREGQWQRLGVESAARGLHELRGRFADALVVLAAIVALVLLLACANLASLLIARGVARQREMAVRAALGAGRARLVRLLLTESLLLASLGAIAGLFFAWWGTHVLLGVLPGGDTSALTLDARPNLRVLAFTAGVTLLTGLLLGAAPVLQLTGGRLQSALADGGRVVARTRSRAGRTLVIAQVALSLVLVLGALLLVRSLNNLHALDAGFTRDGILRFTLDLKGMDYDDARVQRLAYDAVARLAALPGVREATVASLTPISGSDEVRRLAVPGFTPRTREDGGAHFAYVAGGFFDTFGIPLLKGRALRDDDAGRGVAVVSARFVRQFFGDGGESIGRTVFAGGARRALTIVGVAADIRHHDLRAEAASLIYVPLGQADEAPRFLQVAIRAGGGAPATLMAPARAAMRQIDADLPVLGMKTLTAEINERLTRDRLLATLGGFFGGVALLLAGIGIYGLLAYAVSRRTHEIGLRLALGATRTGVIWMVCRESLALAAAGIAIGLAAAWWATRLLAGLLFGLTPTDLAAAGAGVALLLAAALAAGALPARRAARVDPLAALRHE